ncbi:hypothetical protein NXW13_19265 [Bacteroides thetaiotaomicron]|nr:hypothetical protein [Bacteroides thetaiotaomicron]
MAKKFRTDEIPAGKFTEDWGGNKNNTIPARHLTKRTFSPTLGRLSKSL